MGAGLAEDALGKIMRRILRKIAANEHDQLGDIVDAGGSERRREPGSRAHESSCRGDRCCSTGRRARCASKGAGQEEKEEKRRRLNKRPSVLRMYPPPKVRASGKSHAFCQLARRAGQEPRSVVINQNNRPPAPARRGQ